MAIICGGRCWRGRSGAAAMPLANSPIPKVMSRRFRTVAALAIAARPLAALTALGDYVCGKRVRGWNALNLAASRHPKAYARWIALAEPELVARFAASTPAGRDEAPPIHVLVAGLPDETAAIEAAIAAIRLLIVPPHGQIGPLVLDGSPQGVAEAIAALNGKPGDWLLIIGAHDRLSHHFADAARDMPLADSTLDMLFWDEDRLGAAGRFAPWIKPGWDELLYRQGAGLGGAAMTRVGLAAASAAATAQHAGASVGRTLDALMAGAAALSRLAPRHVPLVLSHRADQPAAPPTVTEHSGGEHMPSVSIIVPTRDQPELLGQLLAGLKLLEYPGDTEIILADNDTIDPTARVMLEGAAQQDGYRVICAPGAFNFSQINNAAVAGARGEFLCFLNNDVEPLDGAWLTRMVRSALPRDVGAVGAMLLYPDGTIQHAGIAIGVGGAAGHVQRSVHPAEVAFATWHACTREVSAVTAACMVVRRDHFDAVGGFDAEYFAVAFNDVDLCLRLGSRGLRNIYVAEARLLHHESKSRGSDADAANLGRFSEELAALRARWRTEGHRDPHHSPLFLASAEQCVLAF